MIIINNNNNNSNNNNKFHTINPLLNKYHYFRSISECHLFSMKLLVMVIVFQLLILHHVVLALDTHITMGALVKPALVSTLSQ